MLLFDNNRADSTTTSLSHCKYMKKNRICKFYFVYEHFFVYLAQDSRKGGFNR